MSDTEPDTTAKTKKPEKEDVTDESTEVVADTEEELSPELAAKLAVPVSDMPITFTTLQMLSELPVVPKRFQGKPREMLAAILVGRELGVMPMSAISNLYLVDGDVSMKGKLMSALVHRAGHQLWAEISDTQSTVTAFRRDPYTHELMEVGSFTFSQEDAKQAGLATKAAWENYPKVMRTWRALATVCRLYFSDVLEGVGYVPDDLGIETEIEAIPEDVEITIDGDPIDEAEVVEAATEQLQDQLDAKQVTNS